MWVVFFFSFFFVLWWIEKIDVRQQNDQFNPVRQKEYPVVGLKPQAHLDCE